ncbi:NAD(P)/FAD-dependent oxidoreductase [Streptomyces sp. NPDC002640]
MTSGGRGGRAVVVGASSAGLRAAETLRARGWDGPLTIVGEERQLPYARPPLSKEVLLSAEEPEPVRLPVPASLGARWLLGRAAVRLDTRARRVTLSDGTELGYDGLVVATGARARAPRSAPPGVFTLRGWDDAVALRERLLPGRSVVVAGGGFLGCEIADAARARGASVTLVTRGARPLDRALGREAGAFVAALRAEAGIRALPRAEVTGLRTGADGAPRAVELADGSSVAADTVVAALGAVPAVDWLTGSGLLLDGGVVCDPWLRALRVDGTVAEGVVAAGDVARVPQALAGGARLPTGHWADALAQGAAAATTLATGPSEPYAVVPSSWSDLHGARLRGVGLPSLAEEARVAEYDVPGRRLEITYHHHGRLVGALTAGRMSRLAAHRAELASVAAELVAVR